MLIISPFLQRLAKSLEVSENYFCDFQNDNDYQICLVLFKLQWYYKIKAGQTHNLVLLFDSTATWAIVLMR